MLLKEESLSKKFITKGAWIYFFVFLTAPLGYIIRIILTWDLTPSEVGIIYGTISLLGLLGSYTDFWLTESLNYFLPKYIIKSDYARCKYLLGIALSTQVVTSSIVSLGLYFSAQWVATYYFHAPEANWVIQILSLFFIGSHILQVIWTFLNAIQNIKIQKSIEFIRMIMTIIWGLILFFSGKGNIYTYSWSWIVWIYGGLIFWSIIFYRVYYRKYLNIPQKKDWMLRRQFIHYSLWTLFSANVATVLHQVDMQFLTYFLWVSNTGIYSIYLSLVGIPYLFLWPLLGFLFPVISEIWGKWEMKKIQTIYTLFSTQLGIISLWIGGLFLMAWESIAWLLFGEKFLSAGIALYYIAPFLVFNILVQVNFQILGGLGHVKQRIYILIWALFVNIIINLFCILGFKYGYLPFPSGSSAASFSVGISWVFMWYLSYRSVHEYRGSFGWNIFLKNIIVVIITIVTFFILHGNSSFSFWLVGRMSYLPQIGFAFIGSLTIFLIANFSQIQEFIATIKKVRNGTL